MMTFASQLNFIYLFKFISYTVEDVTDAGHTPRYAYYLPKIGAKVVYILKAFLGYYFVERQSLPPIRF